MAVHNAAVAWHKKPCADCASNVQDLDGGDETYMVHDSTWADAGMEPLGGVLCVSCLERRLGRRLIPNDFTAVPINGPRHKTPRLVSRLMHYDGEGEQ